MYAVFEDGSRQYRVSEGDLVTVDHRDVEEGTRIELTNVLMYVDGENVRVGRPCLDGMRILADVVDFPSKKYVIQKFRRRKNSKRLKGHRQWHVRLKIRHVLLPGQEPPPETEEEQKPAAEETAAATEAPESQPPAQDEASSKTQTEESPSSEEKSPAADSTETEEGEEESKDVNEETPESDTEDEEKQENKS